MPSGRMNWREFGAFLQERRRARGMSRAELATAIRVHEKYVIALEEGQSDGFPEPIYVRGWVRAYCQYLDIDREEIAARYPLEQALDELPTAQRPVTIPAISARRAWRSVPTEDPDAEPVVAKKKPARRRSAPSRGDAASAPKGPWARRLQRVAVIVLVACAITGGAMMYEQRVSKARLPWEMTAQLDNAALPTIAPPNAQAPAWTVAQQSQWDERLEMQIHPTPVDPLWALGRADSLTLTIVAKRATSLWVEADAVRRFKGMVAAGETRSFRTRASFFLTLGNASNVSMWVNGFALRTLSGVDVDVTLSRSALATLIEPYEFEHPPAIAMGPVPNADAGSSRDDRAPAQLQPASPVPSDNPTKSD